MGAVGATPPGCDSHVHFFDRRYRSIVDAQSRPADALPDHYLDVQAALGLERLVVVQPRAYGLDNRCQLAGMERFGDDARGVMAVNADTPVEEVRRLTTLGVCGARFDTRAGGPARWDHLEEVAATIAPFGWHIELHCNGRELAERYDQLAALATPVVVAHLGYFLPPVSVDDPNFVALLGLVDTGHAWVKLSAPYASSLMPVSNHPTSAENHGDLLPLIDALISKAPSRLLWASNWPHEGQAVAPEPLTLAGQAHRWMPSENLRDQILSLNADAFYFDR